MEELKARCMRCKSQQVMSGRIDVKMKNGLVMAKGVCSVCGCKMCKILPKEVK